MTTVMATSMQMPGSFLAGNDEPTSSFRCAPFKASFYLPPSDDSSTSSHFINSNGRPQSISKSQSTHALQSRKRPRTDDKTHTPYRNLSDDNRNSSFDAPSPSPFVNTNYRLAGGVETPADLNSQRADYEREYEYEYDCRPNRYSSQQPLPNQSTGSYFPQTPSLTNNYPGNQEPQTNSPKNGWGKSVLTFTGHVAGKVFNFCWQSAASFKGFYAGGGNGYRFDVGIPNVTSSGWTELEPKDDVFHNDYNAPRGRRDRGSTPVPGEFPNDDHQMEFIKDYMSQPWKYGNNIDPTAKIQAGCCSSTRNSWVMVDEPTSESRDTSPARKKSRASVAPLSNSPRLSHRHVNGNGSITGRPRLAPKSSTHKSSASFASPRTSLANSFYGAVHTQSRQSLPTANHTSNSTVRRHSSRASLASPRRQSSYSSPTVTVNTTQASPEVRKFEQKMRRKEAKEDESIRRLNAQLKAMIQEGKQALGSKIEVMDGCDQDGDIDVDEGFVDGGENWERDYVKPGIWS